MVALDSNDPGLYPSLRWAFSYPYYTVGGSSGRAGDDLGSYPTLMFLFFVSKTVAAQVVKRWTADSNDLGSHPALSIHLLR